MQIPERMGLSSLKWKLVHLMYLLVFLFKIRKFPLKSKFNFFFLCQFFLSSFHSDMQRMAALFGGVQGSPVNLCEPRERSVTQWGDQKLRENVRGWPQRHFRTGIRWKSASMERERKENQLRLEKIVEELQVGKEFARWNNGNQREKRFFLFSYVVLCLLRAPFMSQEL